MARPQVQCASGMATIANGYRLAHCLHIVRDAHHTTASPAIAPLAHPYAIDDGANSAVCLDVPPCKLAEVYRRLGET
jgi:hypothetical protein